jgi:hypothetical protein
MSDTTVIVAGGATRPGEQRDRAHKQRRGVHQALKRVRNAADVYAIALAVNTRRGAS